jgi:hypothetical protein
MFTLLLLYIATAAQFNLIFLTVLGVLFIVAIASFEAETYDSGLIELLSLVAIFCLSLMAAKWSGGHPLDWFIDNGDKVFYAALQYLLVGIFYAVVRWILLSISEASYISNNLESLKKSFVERVNYSGTFEDWLVLQDKMTKLSSSKWRISNWIVLWPISLISYFFKDLLRQLLTAIFDTLKSTLAQIRSTVFHKYGLTAEVLNDKNN